MSIIFTGLIVWFFGGAVAALAIGKAFAWSARHDPQSFGILDTNHESQPGYQIDDARRAA